MENLPHDPGLDGKALTFEALEHNDQCSPLAVKVTDQEGRSAIYIPVGLTTTIPLRDIAAQNSGVEA